MTMPNSTAADANSLQQRAKEARQRALSWMQGGSGSANRAGLELALKSQQSAAAEAPLEPAPFLESGRLLAELGRIEEALAALSRAAELAPDDVEVWTRLGQLQAKVARWSDVERSQQKVLALNPEHAPAYARLCWALRRLGRLSDSIRAGRRAVEVGPDETMGYHHLAFALLARGDFREALEVCSACLQRHPHDVASLAYLPTALKELGRTDEASRLVDFQRLVWATEVAFAEGASSGLDGFNGELAGFVSSAPSRPFDATQTVDLLIEPHGIMVAFRDLVNQALTQYLARLPLDPSHPFLRARPIRWEVEGWATRLRRMQPQEHHFHQHGWVSGVYYVNLPSSVGGGENGRDGYLEFCRFPRYSGGGGQSEFLALPPRPGLLVLFPSYFYHRVSPFEADGERPRISIAFNLIPTQWETAPDDAG